MLRGAANSRSAGATGRPRSSPSTVPASMALRVDRQGPVRRLDGAVEVGVGVRGRDHERLSQDAAADHLLQEQRPEGLRRVPLGVAGQEHQAARPAGDLDVLLEPGRGDLGVHRVRELAALALHLPDHVPLGVRLLHGEVRGEPGRLRAVGGGQQEDPRSLGAQAPELHEVAAPGKGGDREAVAERLAPGREVRRHAVDLLGASGRPAHAGDHLVEDQDEAVLVGELAQPLEEAGRRLGHPGRGLEDQAGDLPGVRREQRAHRVQVVVVEADGEAVLLLERAGVHRRGPDEPVVTREEGLRCGRWPPASGRWPRERA